MKAEELYKKDEDITAEGYIYKHNFIVTGKQIGRASCRERV